MNSYVRGELKFEDDLPYEILAGVQPWNYGVRNNYASASDRLASMMNQNPYMRILVLGGRCDLVCPIDTMRYALDHMQLDAGLPHEHHLRRVRRRPHDVYQPAGPEKNAAGPGDFFEAVASGAHPAWSASFGIQPADKAVRPPIIHGRGSTS